MAKIVVICESTRLGVEYMRSKFNVPPTHSALFFARTIQQLDGRSGSLYINALGWTGPYGEALLAATRAHQMHDITNWNVGIVQQLFSEPEMIPVVARRVAYYLGVTN